MRSLVSFFVCRVYYWVRHLSIKHYYYHQSLIASFPPNGVALLRLLFVRRVRWRHVPLGVMLFDDWAI